WRPLKFTFPFAGPALPVEIWDIVLEYLVGAKPQELLDLSLVCRHWCARCGPYLVHNIVFSNRGDVLREHRTRRREWKGPYCVTIRGAENTRSLGHLGFLAALLGPRWQNVCDVVIEHGDWRTGDFHPDVFHHLCALLQPIRVLRLNDVALPSGAILRSLVSQLRFLKSTYRKGYGMLALEQISFENVSIPPASLSWVSNGSSGRNAVVLQLDNLDANSLDLIAHWLHIALDKDRALLPHVFLSIGSLHEPRLDTVPPIIPFLKTVGAFAEYVTLNIDRSLDICPRINVIWMAPKGNLTLPNARRAP
ncbi:hypothetical protein POSPLADRAFT_1108881, partial [Postia placenta MAD-698-R-SB12]